MLNLSNNKFTSFPDPLFTMAKLSNLDLTGNQLTTRPSYIAEFTRLRSLKISKNPFLKTNEKNIDSILEILKNRGAIIEK
jgi:Leucine-rich repeat (LRR) protein